MSTAVLVPGPHPGRRGQDARRRRHVAVAVALGDGLLGLEAGGRRTTVRLLDVEFVKYRSLLPAAHTTPRCSRSPTWASRSSGSRWSPTAVTTCGCRSATDSLTLTAGGDDEGRAEEELPARSTGEPLPSRSTPATCWTGSARCTPTRSGWRSPPRPAGPGPTRSPDGAAPATDADADRRTPWPDRLPGYRYLVMPARLPG